MKEAPSPRPALYTLFAIVVIDLIGFGIVIPILPFYADSFGAGASLLGLLVTSYSGFQFLFAPIWGRLSDRFGRRPVMLATIAGTAVSLALLGWAPSLAWLFAARLLGGAFGANISVASAYITDLTSENERTKYMGFLGASFGVGFVLGPAIGGFLAPYGYAVPMWVAAGLAAVNAGFAYFTLAEPPRHVATDGQPATEKLAGLFTRVPGGDPAQSLIRKLCASVFVFSFAVSQLETLFAFLMMERFGYDAANVAFILVFMAFVMILIQGGGLRVLVKRLGEPRLLQTGALLLVPSLAVVPFVPTVAWLLVPLALSAIGRALCYPSMMGLIANAAPAGHRGAVMGSFQASASLARVLGPFAAGFLYDWSRPAPFVVGGALMLIVLGIAFALPLPEPLPERLSESPPNPA